MAGISDDDVRRVREASDLVALFGERTPVRQRGRDFWCCCPFHEERTPSCKIDPSAQLWHCFGCGEGGDVFSYVMKLEDLSFPEAVRWLAERAGVQITESGGPQLPRGRKARLKEVCKRAAEFYHTQLMRSKSPDAAPRARVPGQPRRLGGSVPNDWDLGFAPGRGALVRHLRQLGFSNEEMVEANVATDGGGRGLRDRFYNRVMFPIRDVQGECIAFGGRVIGQGEPKYLNSQETPIFHKSEVLYGLDKAKAAMAATGVAIVVEGYTDVIALSEAGVKNVVATLGTALTARHIRALSRHAQHKIVYLFDGDAAGQRAADRALQFIDRSMTPEAGRSKIELFAVTLPDDLDPADFVRQRGADELRSCLEGAQPLLKYGIERRLARHDLSTAEGRSRAMAEALQVLAPIKDSLLAKDYAVQIAGRVRAREEDALEALSRLTPPARTEEAAARAGRRSGGGRHAGAGGARPRAAGERRGAQSPAVRARVSVHGRALSGMGPLVRADARADAVAQRGARGGRRRAARRAGGGSGHHRRRGGGARRGARPARDARADGGHHGRRRGARGPHAVLGGGAGVRRRGGPDCRPARAAEASRGAGRGRGGVAVRHRHGLAPGPFVASIGARGGPAQARSGRISG